MTIYHTFLNDSIGEGSQTIQGIQNDGSEFGIGISSDIVCNNLQSLGISTFNGNVDLGNSTSDTVTFTARVDSSIFPSTNGTLNLGSTSNQWNNVYATTFNGSLVGNADSATRLFNARNFSITGDVDAPAVSFDGTGNVNLVTTLDNTGVIAATYGSSTQVPVFVVDAKGRITSVTNTSVNFSSATVSNSDKLTNARNFSITGDVDAPAVSFDGTGNVNLVTTLDNSGVVANTYGSSTQVPVFAVDAKGRITSVSNTSVNFSSATVAQSDAIKTVTSSATTLYPTFVDSNNNPAAYEILYTDGGITYNASTNLLNVSNITVSGISTFNLSSTTLPTASSSFSFELTNNTTLQIRVKGTDGVTRVGTVTLS